MKKLYTQHLKCHIYTYKKGFVFFPTFTVEFFYCRVVWLVSFCPLASSWTNELLIFDLRILLAAFYILYLEAVRIIIAWCFKFDILLLLFAFDIINIDFFTLSSLFYSAICFVLPDFLIWWFLWMCRQSFSMIPICWCLNFSALSCL